MAWKLRKWLGSYGTVQIDNNGKIEELSVKDGHDKTHEDLDNEADLIKWINKELPLLRVVK